jgi:hypothetical protein
MGAEIRRTSSAEARHVNFADVILEGRIETGDYDKLLKLIDERCGEAADCPNVIFLASPGGDLIEAMKIGRLVRKLRLETSVPIDVPPVPSDLPPQDRQKIEADLKAFKSVLKDAKANYMCVSACFFIFVAGVYRETNAPLDGDCRSRYLFLAFTGHIFPRMT